MYRMVLEQGYQEKYWRYLRNKNKNTCMSYLIYYCARDTIECDQSRQISYGIKK